MGSCGWCGGGFVHAAPGDGETHTHRERESESEILHERNYALLKNEFVKRKVRCLIIQSQHSVDF